VRRGKIGRNDSNNIQSMGKGISIEKRSEDRGGKKATIA